MRKIIRFLYFKLKLLFHPLKNERPAIGLVVKSFDKGGLERVVLDLYKGYKRMGYDAYILIIGNEGGKNIQNLYSPSDYRILYGSGKAFFDFCLRKNIRVLHYHHETFCMRLFKKLGFKVYYTVHSLYTWKSDAEMKAYAKRLKYCDKIFAVSDWVKDYFSARTGIKDNLVTVYNGTEEQIFYESLPDNVQVKIEGVEETDIVFLNVASISSVKNQLLLVQAFEKACHTQKNLKLVLAGNVLDKQYAKKLFAKIECSPVRENIIYLEYVERETLVLLMRTRANCMVMSSISEGFSIAMIEALMCGLPVIMPDFKISTDPLLSLDIVTVPTQYKNPSTLTPEKISSLSSNPDSVHIQRYADAILKTAETYEALKKNINPEKYKIFSLDEMVKNYMREMLL